MSMPLTSPAASRFIEVLSVDARPDPYPLFASLRAAGVTEGPEGIYTVARYADVAALLRDSHLSSDERQGKGANARATTLGETGVMLPITPPFIFLDPPDHGRLRKLVMKEFTPRVVEGMRGRITQLVNTLLDAAPDAGQLDVVRDLAYPLPVTVICELLGVPPEDEARFHGWSTTLAHNLDPVFMMVPEKIASMRATLAQMIAYLRELIAARRSTPGPDLLSALIAAEEQGDRLTEEELVTSFLLLLVAGHETTVNLIANATLQLLRYPDALARFRIHPELAGTLVEEVLRYDSPVQFRTRIAMEPITLHGVTIPAHATVVLLLAAANRDPEQFPDADDFVIDRTENRHLGFGGGIHYCIGASLARLEGQLALTALVQRLEEPRLVQNPPEYRENAALRGPASLLVAYTRLTPMR